MASLRQLPSGRWQVQIRRNGRQIGKTFPSKTDARDWISKMEPRLERGALPSKPAKSAKTFGDLIDLHIADMAEVGRLIGRSKSAILRTLRSALGAVPVGKLDRNCFIEFGRSRALQGAGPVTVGLDFGIIKLVLSNAAAVHGISSNIEALDQARVAMKRLDLVGKTHERTRRPTAEEIARLLRHFESDRARTIPMARILKVAIATCLRQEEIFKIAWKDLDLPTRVVLVRNRKHPNQKSGNDQRIPLLALTGYDAFALIREQRLSAPIGQQRIFPYNHKSAGTAFTVCRQNNWDS